MKFLEGTHFNMIEVDNEYIIIPNEYGWRVLIENPRKVYLDEPPLLLDVSVGSIQKMLQVIQPYSELLLGLREVGLLGWLPLYILMTPLGCQRVHIEWLRCGACSWYGMAANPLESDLYLGLERRREAYLAAFHHPVKRCPNCASELPRHPIWTEPLPAHQ